MPERDRAALKKPSRSLFIALGIVAILASMFFFVTYAINHNSAMHFQYEGHSAESRIESLTSPAKTLYVGYTYTDAEGNVHHGSDAYPLVDAGTLKIGQTLDVLYLENVPEKSRIAAHQAMMMDSVKRAPWEIIGLMATGGLLSLSIGTRRRKR